MRLWRIIAVATLAEGATLAALASVAGLFGGVSAWLDLLNNGAPLWLVMAMVTAPLAWLLMTPGAARLGVVGLALAATLVSGVEVLPEVFVAMGPISHGAGARVRIVTFNAWSDNADPDAVTALVNRTDPDAAALIEMGWPLIHSRLNALGRYPYRTFIRHRCPPDMVLISKRPFTAYGCQITTSASRPEVTETVVWGRTTAPDGRPFTLATTHYSWPFPHGGQEMQRPALARFVKEHAGEDLILTGDFNLTPWTFALRGQDHDLKPLTRRTHAVATWPAMIARLYRPAPFAILPIDHIYAAPVWRTERIARLARAGSDHYGVVAEFSR